VQELKPLNDVRKDVICNTAKTLQWVTNLVYPALRNTTEAPRDKNSKPYYRVTRD
jgi:hypothetical protein